jgi:hypothetical protein
MRFLCGDTTPHARRTHSGAAPQKGRNPSLETQDQKPPVSTTIAISTYQTYSMEGMECRTLLVTSAKPLNLFECLGPIANAIDDIDARRSKFRDGRSPIFGFCVCTSTTTAATI